MSLIILGILTVLLFTIVKKDPQWLWSWDGDTWLAIAGVSTGMAFIIGLIGYSTSGIRYNSWIEKRQAFVVTLEEARSNPENYELASITHKIAEYNEYLASEKYWNSLYYFELFVDDRFENLKPIE